MRERNLSQRVDVYNKAKNESMRTPDLTEMED